MKVKWKKVPQRKCGICERHLTIDKSGICKQCLDDMTKFILQLEEEECFKKKSKKDKNEPL